MKRKDKPKSLELIDWESKVEKLKTKYNRNKDAYSKHKKKHY
tara:strand:- start:468 stop:593 length:126 start_codon:yes stop_codon:yes gene_type:complete